MDESKNAKYIFRKEEEVLSFKYIFTNSSPDYPIDKACKDFIIKNCLTPRLEFNHYLRSIKTKIGFQNYAVIHLRLHDGEIFDIERCSNIKNILKDILAKYDGNLLLLSSDDIYDAHLMYSRIKALNLKKGHLGLDNISLDEARDTLVEFMLLTTATKIFQLSVYPWGSGFSEIAHRIFDIELEQFSL